ncbi:MAG: zeta toxin family protein [Acidobacteria bacterium]|nr:zeta toxin family protein [Acidobacteriota bacterium]
MSADGRAPVCRIIAGPNGAGKTTFALKYLPLVAPGTAFVNADLIAAGLSPLAPEQQLVAASRLFLQQIEHHVGEGQDFAFETTLSGRGYLRLVRRLREAGWRVELLYLALPNVELSRQRVAERVAHGGHAIAPADIARRFPRSLRNLLDVYAVAADHARCFLNTGPAPDIVFVQDGEKRTILNETHYDHLVKEAYR